MFWIEPSKDRRKKGFVHPSIIVRIILLLMLLSLYWTYEITFCLNFHPSLKPELVFPVHSVPLLLGFLSSISSGDFETIFWSAFPTNTVHEPFQSSFFGSSNDSCGTPFPILMSDTECMFDVLFFEALALRPVLLRSRKVKRRMKKKRFVIL